MYGPQHLPCDSEGRAGTAIASGQRLGSNRRRKSGATQHLHSCEAVAARADCWTPSISPKRIARTPVRFTSTQPTQALTLLNSVSTNQEAALFAARLRREAGPDVGRQVRLGLYLATSRPASDEEMRRGLDLIDGLEKKDGVSPDAALKYFCLMAMNLNEFMYLD